MFGPSFGSPDCRHNGEVSQLADNRIHFSVGSISA
jgi:hypothetical protein